MPACSSAALFTLPWPMPGTIERSSLISALMKPARRSSFTADVAPMLKGILDRTRTISGGSARKVPAFVEVAAGS